MYSLKEEEEDDYFGPGKTPPIEHCRCRSLKDACEEFSKEKGKKKYKNPWSGKILTRGKSKRFNDVVRYCRKKTRVKKDFPNVTRVVKSSGKKRPEEKEKEEESKGIPVSKYPRQAKSFEKRHKENKTRVLSIV